MNPAATRNLTIAFFVLLALAAVSPVVVGSARLPQTELLTAQELQVARTLKPNDGETFYLSGVVAQRWQKEEEAFEYYRQAVEKAPSELAYLMAESEMLVSLNRSDEALALLQSKIVFFEHSGGIRDAATALAMVACPRTSSGLVGSSIHQRSKDDNARTLRMASSTFQRWLASIISLRSGPISSRTSPTRRASSAGSAPTFTLK